MLIITKDNLIDKIEEHGFKIAVIYENSLRGKEPGTHTPYFEKYEEETPELLIQKIERFNKNYPGIFSIVLRKSGGGYNTCQVNVKFENVKEPGQEQNLSLNGYGVQSGFETPEQMEDRLLKKIKDGMIRERLEAQNKSLQAQLDGLNTTGGRLANMVEQWISAKFLGEKIPSMQGNDGTTVEENKEIDPIELKEALNTLLELLGGDTIIKLSKKLTPGDSIINMVKQYAK